MRASLAWAPDKVVYLQVCHAMTASAHPIWLVYILMRGASHESASTRHTLQHVEQSCSYAHSGCVPCFVLCQYSFGSLMNV